MFGENKRRKASRAVKADDQSAVAPTPATCLVAAIATWGIVLLNLDRTLDDQRQAWIGFLPGVAVFALCLYTVYRRFDRLSVLLVLALFLSFCQVSCQGCVLIGYPLTV